MNMSLASTSVEQLFKIMMLNIKQSFYQKKTQKNNNQETTTMLYDKSNSEILYMLAHSSQDHIVPLSVNKYFDTF